MHPVNRRKFLANAVALPAIAQGIGNPFPAAAASPDGFVPLFNGRDLSGWIPVNVAPSTFSVRDGMIVSTGIPTGVMRTPRHYENFILELEWRHMKPGGNAGVFVWGEPLTAPGVPFAKGIEVQVIDGDSPEGVWTGHGDLFSIHGARCVPDRPHPRGWERCLPSEKRANPAGQWNHYRVEARDGRISLAVNGKVVSGVSDCRPRKGYLCLESEGSECHFRNLRIRELPSSNPPADLVAGVDQGYKSLYTGIDLAGWAATAAHAGHWTAKDWTLTADGRGPSELRTLRAYAPTDIICDLRNPADGGRTSLVLSGSTEETVDFSPTGGKWVRMHLHLRPGQLTVTQGDLTTVQLRPSQPRGPVRLGLRHDGRPAEFANLFVRETEGTPGGAARLGA